MPTPTKPGTTHSQQNILNWSFDPDYNNLAVGMLGLDNGTLRYVKVNADGELITNLETSDIEIGAVEIKNSSDDTRATVGSDGLHVDVQASALPTGAATETKQDNTITELATLNSLIPSSYDYISLGYTGSNLTTVIFKSGGSGGSTVSTLTLAYTGSQLDSVTKT